MRQTRTLKDWLRLWLTLCDSVDRRSYLFSGLFLGTLKIGGDALLFWLGTGESLDPRIYLSPWMIVASTPLWFHLAFFGWMLPFLWIGVSMSLRRAINAGKSAWIAIFFFVPFVKWIMILILCALPTKQPTEERPAPLPKHSNRPIPWAIFALGLSLLVGSISMLVSVFGLGRYGETLFLGTPFMMGMVGSFFYNLPSQKSLRRTFGFLFFCFLASCSFFFFIGWEGIICIAMAIPAGILPLIIGGYLGYWVASFRQAPPSHAAIAILLLPALAFLENTEDHLPLYEAITTIEIEAPPEKVWKNVVSFSELPEPNWLVFKAGVAYPQRARIDGSGVGAVRHCEFSTGAFVEPITCWEEPLKLSFDVIEQPPPMKELSFYEQIDAPHLDGYFRSKRGEFRLIALPGGRTRLEGSTWYEIELHPQFVWKIYSDWLIHRIHERVLEHIRRLSEQDRL